MKNMQQIIAAFRAAIGIAASANTDAVSKEELEGATEKIAQSQADLGAEQTAHKATKNSLKAEQDAHVATKAELKAAQDAKTKAETEATAKLKEADDKVKQASEIAAGRGTTPQTKEQTEGGGTPENFLTNVDDELVEARKKAGIV